MSQPQKSVRSIMEPVGGSDRYHLGEPLITITPKDLPARTRTISPFATATLKLVGAATSKNAEITTPQKETYDMNTLAGRMDYWQFQYDSYQISNDGKGRAEYVDVSKMAAIGGSEETANLAALNEGAKNLSTKEKKK